jgi:ATP-dependent RNA helicase DeaD
MAEALHGDMIQSQRDKVMTKFRKGTIDILIATDVAARGIDVDDIEAVFNYDIPTDEEYYVHRVGRTGRIGKAGKAFTLVSGRGLYKLKEIQRYTKSAILPLKPPTLVDVEEKRLNNILDNLKTTIAAGHLFKYVAIIEKLLEDTSLENEPDKFFTTLDIAAAFLKITMDQSSNPVSQEKTLEAFRYTGAENSSRAQFRPANFRKDRGRSRRDHETNFNDSSSKWMT